MSCKLGVVVCVSYGLTIFHGQKLYSGFGSLRTKVEGSEETFHIMADMRSAFALKVFVNLNNIV